MSFRIRRRRFGQLAVASDAATDIANLAGKGCLGYTDLVCVAFDFCDDTTDWQITK